MSWLLFLSVYCHPTIRLLPVNKLPRTLVTQQGMEMGRGNLRVQDAETQLKVGLGKFFVQECLWSRLVWLLHTYAHIL